VFSNDMVSSYPCWPRRIVVSGEEESYSDLASLTRLTIESSFCEKSGRMSINQSRQSMLLHDLGFLRGISEPIPTSGAHEVGGRKDRKVKLRKYF
jgi:hypothetical protein